MLRHIRMTLARNSEFPNGNSERGYEFYAPLDEEGHIDLDEWKETRKRCTVHRFWAGEDDMDGELHHTRHGFWAFSYEPGEEDDEAIFRFASHAFKEGEYITVTEQDGQDITFHVVAVR